MLYIYTDFVSFNYEATKHVDHELYCFFFWGGGISLDGYGGIEPSCFGGIEATDCYYCECDDNIDDAN